VIVLGLDLVEFSNLKSQFKLLQMLADQAAIAIRVHHLGKSQLQQLQSKRVIAASSTAPNKAHQNNNPFSMIKKYLKMPWNSETVK
jgi:hypothetical protein